MPDPTFKIDSTTVMSKSGTTVSVDSGLNIKPAINASGTAPIYAVRAWGTFNGSSYSDVGGENVCAIHSSANISKIVRTGAGYYKVVFSVAMPDADYAVTSNAGENAYRTAVIRDNSTYLKTTTQFWISVLNQNANGYEDDNQINFIVVC